MFWSLQYLETMLLLHQIFCLAQMIKLQSA
jgi:hypothetical protein